MDPYAPNVARANKVDDPLSLLPASFREYKVDGNVVHLSTERVSSLSSNTKDWLLDLMTRNMKTLYKKSSWGWNARSKKKEMFEPEAIYLIARESASGTPLGFCHFRFDLDYNQEVLYVYEVQMEGSHRGKGLGTHLMRTLELLALKSNMEKIILTVFKENHGPKRLFKERLHFTTDETSPEECFDYEILSKHRSQISDL